MNVKDIDQLTSRYDNSRSWPYFQTLELAAPAESEDDQIELAKRVRTCHGSDRSRRARWLWLSGSASASG